MHGDKLNNYKNVRLPNVESAIRYYIIPLKLYLYIRQGGVGNTTVLNYVK